MSDFMIQSINLDQIPHQACDYGYGLEKKLKCEDINPQQLATTIGTKLTTIQRLIAGTSNQGNQLRKLIYKHLGWHAESLILDGANFFAGDHADKVMVA